MGKRSVFFRGLLSLLLLLGLLTAPAAADASGYASATVSGHGVSWVAVDMSAGVEARVLLANNSIRSSQPVADMAEAGGAFAAVNGTCFSTYDGNPEPWGAIIQNGRLLHAGGGAVAGITYDGRLLVDRLRFSFSGYVNGVPAFYPWRLNHLGEESGAITVFTPEFAGSITPPAGALTVLVDNGGRVTSITSDAFTVPAGGFAVLFNEGMAYLVPERFQLGDAVTYEAVIETTFTDAADWDNVKEALGAGPSLLIRGAVTADGAAEGFTDEEVSLDRADRSFIGAAADGRILVGTIDSATLLEAAAVCQGLSLVDAMCLDGGASCALYYNGSKSAGRPVNNALGFFYAGGGSAVPAGSAAAYGRGQPLSLDGRVVTLQSYNIDGSNYFKLRDLALLLSGTQARFSVDYDSVTRAITLTGGQPYAPVGGEGELLPEQNLQVRPSSMELSVNGLTYTVTAYNIGGNNYFKLRDLGWMLDFGVAYDAQQRIILLDPSAGYSE